MRLLPDEQEAASEPLDQILRLVRGEEQSGAGSPRARWRRYGNDLLASGAVHLVIIAALIFVGMRRNAITPPAAEPREETVPMTFVQPVPEKLDPLKAPAPLEAPPPPAREAPPREIVPPLGPLPDPNRMGEQAPVPPPPKDSHGGKPADDSAGGPQDETGKPALAQQGAPDAVSVTGSPDPPPDSDDRAAPGLEGGSSPTAEGTHGSMAIPSNPSPVPPGQVPGAGAGGTIPKGTGRRPQKRGLELGVPYDTGAFQNFSFEHSDYDWSDYWSVMYWAIWRKWHERLYLNLLAFERESQARGEPGLDGTALIRFTIERNGNVSKVELLTPSGIQDLDLSSSDAIREADLPPLPSDFPHSQERVTGSFRLEVGDVRDMRQALTSMRARGQF